MPSRSVTEYTCERCTRSWYEDASCKAPYLLAEVKIETKHLSSNLGSVEFKCLCEGCQKTVTSLLEQVAKVLKKSAPVRGAKKAASEDKTPPATSTTPEAPASAAPNASADPARSAKQPAAVGAPTSTHQSARPAPNPTRG